MLKKRLALLMAVAMMLGALGILAEDAAPVQDPVLATVGDEVITLSEVEALLPQLAHLLQEGDDYRQAVDVLVQQRVLQKQIVSQGLDAFTPEEEAAFAAEAQTQWDAGIESYVSYYLSEDTPEARAQLKDQAEDFYAEQGFTLQDLADSLRQRASMDRLSEQLMGDYEPAEEEIQETFQRFGEAYQENYQDNIMAYEYNTMYNQQASWYTPEGYRGIIHILLQPDPALMDNYTRLMAAHEEQQSQQASETTQPEDASQGEEQADTPVTEAQEPVTQEMVDAARQAILDSQKEAIEGIYASLQAGESFESLIAQLGQDPGMQMTDNLQNGYMVHRDSVVWDPVFTQAAFSEKMVQVGDVSDPVVGSNGIHILKYLRDVPAGLHMTEQIRQEIVDYLMAVKENEVFSLALQGWEQEANVVYHEEAIMAAQSAVVSPEQPWLEGPEAVEPQGEEPVEDPVDVPVGEPIEEQPQETTQNP